MSAPPPPPRPGQRLVFEPADYSSASAEAIVGCLESAIRESGRCALALSGGSTPMPIYQAISRPPLVGRIDWSQVEIYFGDERRVSPRDRASNYRMARSALLDHVPIPAASVHRMEGERWDADAAAREYERILPESLDLLLLGIGADGHTASLFPGSPAVQETDRRVVPVTGPAAPRERMTITPPVIAAARRIVVMATGESKATAVARALEEAGPPSEVPARLAVQGIWLLDTAAARALHGTPA